jgi:hypothetical protein
MIDKFTWFIVAIIYIAILYSLVRPGSKGTVTVNQIFTLFSDLVRGAMGQTYTKGTGSDPDSSGKWSSGNS